MKAMWLGFAAAIAVAIVAGVVLTSVETTTVEKYASSSTRP